RTAPLPPGRSVWGAVYAGRGGRVHALVPCCVWAACWRSPGLGPRWATPGDRCGATPFGRLGGRPGKERFQAVPGEGKRLGRPPTRLFQALIRLDGRCSTTFNPAH